MGDDGKETTAKVCRWLGFVAAWCILSIGIARIVASNASVRWPHDRFYGDAYYRYHHGFVSDVNATSWRARLCSFMPSTFADVWTPTVFGVLGIVAHLDNVDKLKKPSAWITKNFTHYFIFHFLSYLFGGVGYAGGWGIIFSIPSILCTILSFVLIFLHNVSAKLDISMSFSAKFNAKDSSDQETFAKVTRWFGFVSAIMAIILGIVHPCFTNAHIRWPHTKYYNQAHFFWDVNQSSWRLPLFTFIPDIFCDIWTPLVMGILGTLPHLQIGLKYTERFVKDFVAYFFFHFILAMFGMLGYRGGLGIIFSIMPFLTALFSLIMVFIGNSYAGLKLEFKWSAQLSGEGTNTRAGN